MTTKKVIMSLYLINRHHCDYEEYENFVVRANDVDEARKIAYAAVVARGLCEISYKDILDPIDSSCEEIPKEGGCELISPPIKRRS